METSRIILRPWRDDDAETLYKYASDPEVGSRAGWPPHKSVEESLEIIRTLFHSDHIWAIVLKNAGGDACVHSGVPIQWIDGTLPLEEKATLICNDK